MIHATHHRTRSLILLGACALLTLSACSASPGDANTAAESSSSAEATAAWPRTVTVPAGPDTEANTLTLDAQPVRIATLDYESTEVVAEFGAAAHIVLMPEAVRNPALGGHIDELAGVADTFAVASAVDAETIISVAPDLVVMSPRHGTEAPLVGVLEQAGIPTLELPESWTSLSSMHTNIELIGAVTGFERESEALIETLTTGVDQASAHTSITPAPRVLLLNNQAGRAFVTAGDSLPVELLELAGGVNAAAEIGITRTGPITAEQVVQANPDAVVLIDMNGTGDRMFTELLSNDAVATLSGFGEDRVLRLDGREVQALGLTATVTGLGTLTDWVAALPQQ